MNIQNILVTIATSTVVSGGVCFILKTYLKSRIEHAFHVELAKVIGDIAGKLADQRDLAARRGQGYPLIVELVYRIRNMARDLSTSFSSSNLSLADEIVARTRDLEDIVFRYRIDLERDDLFVNVHAYKNAAKNFNMKLSDVKYFIEHKENGRADNARKELVALFSTLEGLHSAVIHELSETKSEPMPK